MVNPRTPTKRKRARRADLESRYFPSPKRSSTSTQTQTSESSLQLPFLPLPLKSRFFQPRFSIDTLMKNPAFVLFYEEFVHAMLQLYYAKPILIQEHVSHSPWKVLVAVTLLNKTAGKKSIPVFFELMDQWPTPMALAQAPLSLLFEILKDLGLGEMRSQRLVDISQSILSDPPTTDRLRPSRGKTTALFSAADGSISVKEVKYPPTAVSHIPGCGPYALDSYRIFCVGGDEWKRVRPKDKELIKYLQWRWGVEEYRKWDPVHGPGKSIDLQYIRELTSSLTMNPISH